MSASPIQNDDGDRRKVFLGGVVPLVIMSTVFVFARLFVRSVVVHRLQLDDLLISLSMAFTWLAAGFLFSSMSEGYGVVTLTDEQRLTTFSSSNLVFGCGILAFILQKLAIMVMMEKMLNPPKWHRSCLWILVVCCSLGLLGNVAGFFALCKGREASSWVATYVTNRCIIPWKALLYAAFSSILSATSNLCIVTYATLAIRKMALRGKKKLAMAIAVSLGFVAIASTVYKCTRLSAFGRTDFPYDTTGLVIWTFIESTATTIAACIPILEPLVDIWSHSPWSATNNSSTSPSGRQSLSVRHNSIVQNITGRYSHSAPSPNDDADRIERVEETTGIISGAMMQMKRHIKFEVKYEDLGSDTGEIFRVFKNQEPDGTITTTVEVLNESRRVGHPQYW